MRQVHNRLEQYRNNQYTYYHWQWQRAAGNISRATYAYGDYRVLICAVLAETSWRYAAEI